MPGSEDSLVETVLCPNCLMHNLPATDFCTECGCPIGPYVNLDPLKRIYSQGWIYRKAVSGRISLIVLVGMWLLFGHTLLVCIWMLTTESQFHEGVPFDYSIFFTLPSAVGCAVILYRVTRNYLRWK